MKNFFILLCASLFLFNCHKKSEAVNKEHSKVLKYLSSEKDYENKAKYRSYFKVKYEEYIDKKEYRNAEESLVEYGELLKSITASDTILYKETLNFIKKDYPVKKDTVFANLYLLAGLQLSYEIKTDSATIFIEKAIKYSEEFPDSFVHLDAKNLLGMNYSYGGRYQKAIPIFLELIKRAEQKTDRGHLAALYNNLAYCYDSFYAYQEAEKYYIKSGDLCLASKDTATYIKLRNNYVMNNYGSQNDTLKTLKLIAITDNIYKKYTDRDEFINANMDEIYSLKYLLEKKYDSAYFYSQSASNYFKKTSDTNEFDFYEADEEEIYFAKNGYLKNAIRLEELLNFFIEEQDLEYTVTASNLLYRNALKNKNYKNAIKFRDIEVENNAMIQKKNANGQLYELERVFQSEKKEKLIATQNAKIQKNKLYIVGLVLVLAILILSVVLYLNKLKRDKIINEKIKNEKFIVDLLENVEIERNRIAYELHDSINHSLLSVKNAILSKREILSDTISKIIEEVRVISRNLYPVILEKVGLTESIKSLSENFSNETDLFVTTEINYSNKIEKSKELHLYRIIQETLNNTLKHGNATISKINISTDDNFLILKIKDNGEGFDVEKQIKSKNSFGLQGITKRALVLNAKLDIKSDDNGTEINLKMPIL